MISLSKNLCKFKISGSFSSAASALEMFIEASAGDHSLLSDEFALAAQIFDCAEKKHQTGNLSKGDFQNLLMGLTAGLRDAIDEKRLFQAFNQDPAFTAGHWPFITTKGSSCDCNPEDPDNQGKQKIIQAELGNWLINHLRICRIDGMLCYYRHGTYVCDPAPNSDFKKPIKLLIGLFGGPLSASNEIMDYLRDCAPSYSQDAETGALMIPAENGVIVIDPEAPNGPAATLVPSSPVYHLIGGVSVPYVSDANSDLLDKTLATYADGDPRTLAQIKQFAALCLLNSKRFKSMFRKFPVLIGEPRCGKSHLLDMISNMIGKGEVSTLAPNALSRQFDGSQLRGKRINIADDFGNKLGSNATAVVKKIISGDPITVDIKNCPNETLWATPVFIGSCNELPPITDKGLIDRLYPIPFTHQFREGEDAPEGLNSVEVLSALLAMAVKAICQMLASAKQNKPVLVWSSKALEMIAEIKGDSDPLASYIAYLREAHPEQPNPAQELCAYASIQIAYADFTEWRKSSGLTGSAPSIRKFDRAMCLAFGLGIYVTTVKDETGRQISVRKFQARK